MRFIFSFVSFLSLALADDSFFGLHFKVDKSFLASNPQTDKNEVTFPGLEPGSGGNESLLDLSGCLRMKPDFTAQQVTMTSMPAEPKRYTIKSLFWIQFCS